MLLNSNDVSFATLASTTVRFCSSEMFFLKRCQCSHISSLKLMYVNCRNLDGRRQIQAEATRCIRQLLPHGSQPQRDRASSIRISPEFRPNFAMLLYLKFYELLKIVWEKIGAEVLANLVLWTRRASSV
jgi:hypothetical protein